MLKSFFLMTITSFIAVGALADSTYDQHIPYYAETCAMTQIKKKNDDPGGTAGHAVVYLKGVCIDESADYPRLKTCDYSEEDIKNPEAGVGVSVNKMFANVNWVAIPGKSLFFNGGLDPQQTLTSSVESDLIQKLLTMRTHRGIILKKNYMDRFSEMTKDMNLSSEERRTELEKFVIGQSISTDFAMTFGRHLYCVRIPVEKRMLENAVNYLNDLNENYFSAYQKALQESGAAEDSYVKSDNEYSWNGLDDNCTHVTYNALAAMGFHTPASTGMFRQFRILSGFINMKVPADTMIKILERSYGKFVSQRWVKSYAPARDALMEDGWLPQQAGVIIERFKQHEKNELYEVNKPDAILILRDFLLYRGLKKNQAKRMLEDPVYNDLKENMLYWRARYSDFVSKHFERAPKDSLDHAYRRAIMLNLDKTNRILYELSVNP